MIYEEELSKEEEEIQIEDLEQTPSKMEDNKSQVHDPMEEVNLDTGEEPKITFINYLLSIKLKEQIISLLQEFKDFFAWNYDEMLGLDKGLVEHRLLIKPKFHHFQQPPRRMSKEVEVKKEIEKLLKAKFIKPTRYVQWLENIVHVMKINEKLRVCVDFRDLNFATPKDMYVMPIANILVDYAANNELLSFMDGFSCYNHILIAVKDIPNTAFRCPGSIWTF